MVRASASLAVGSGFYPSHCRVVFCLRYLIEGGDILPLKLGTVPSFWSRGWSRYHQMLAGCGPVITQHTPVDLAGLINRYRFVLEIVQPFMARATPGYIRGFPFHTPKGVDFYFLSIGETMNNSNIYMRYNCSCDQAHSLVDIIKTDSLVDSDKAHSLETVSSQCVSKTQGRHPILASTRQSFLETPGGVPNSVSQSLSVTETAKSESQRLSKTISPKTALDCQKTASLATVSETVSL